MTKRILKEFQINEISVVDRPAQKGAKMTIMKRDETAEFLGKNINSEDNMSEKTKTVEELTANLETVTKSVTELTEKLAKAEAEREEAVKISKMSDSEKTFMEKMDGKDKKDFMDMSPEDRKKKMDGMKKNDETVTVEGQTISKSEVGDAQFAIFKAQAEKIAKAEDRIAKAEETAALAILEKRASDEFGNLPGTDAEKAVMLKALSTLDKSVSENIETILKAANEANAGAFENIGKKNGTVEDTVEAKIEKRAKEIAAEKGVTYEKGYTLALDEDPTLYAEVK